MNLRKAVKCFNISVVEFQGKWQMEVNKKLSEEIMTIELCNIMKIVNPQIQNTLSLSVERKLNNFPVFKNEDSHNSEIEKWKEFLSADQQ